jgi:hypothetical protein
VGGSEFAVPKNDTDWDALISAWIAAEESQKRTGDNDPAWWAVETVIMWNINSQHEALWQFITRSFERPMTDEAFGMIAAGPLEDLISYHGQLYIDRIEALARKNPRFNYLLGGVWKNASTDDVWSRVEKIRLKAW